MKYTLLLLGIICSVSATAGNVNLTFSAGVDADKVVVEQNPGASFSFDRNSENSVSLDVPGSPDALKLLFYKDGKYVAEVPVGNGANGDVTGKVYTDNWRFLKENSFLEIGGRKWTSDRGVTLIEADSADTELTSRLSGGKTGVFFLDGKAEGASFSLGTVVYSQDIAVVGRYSNRREKVGVTAAQRYSKGSSGFKDIEFISSGPAIFNQMVTNNAPAEGDGIYIDGCSFSGFTWILCAGAENQLLPPAVHVFRSDFGFDRSLSLVNATHTFTAVPLAVKDIRISGNFFHSTNGEQSISLYQTKVVDGKALAPESDSLISTDISICDNTFFNVRQVGMVYIYAAKSLTLCGNVFCDDLAVEDNILSWSVFRLASADKPVPQVTVKDNSYYSANGARKWDVTHILSALRVRDRIQMLEENPLKQ